MSIALDTFCFPVLLAKLFATVLSVTTGGVGCWWHISSGSVLMTVDFWKFSNYPPNSASVADTMIFLIMLHFIWTGPFLRSIDCISVLDFGPRKIIYFVASRHCSIKKY